MEITSPSQFRAVEKMLSGEGAGPVTLVLIWSKTCPHCHTYMPLWKDLSRTKDKATNMISMESDIYQQSPLAEKKDVSSVPTVLYIDENGEIQEVDDARNKTLMTNIIQTAAPPAAAANASLNTYRASPSAAVNRGVPGTEVTPNPLPVMPGTTMRASANANIRNLQNPSPKQVGGNALASALMQAAPAAILAGAYSMYSRSSGLPPATRRKMRRRARKNRKSRKHRRSRRH